MCDYIILFNSSLYSFKLFLILKHYHEIPNVFQNSHLVSVSFQKWESFELVSKLLAWPGWVNFRLDFLESFPEQDCGLGPSGESLFPTVWKAGHCIVFLSTQVQLDHALLRIYRPWNFWLKKKNTWAVVFIVGRLLLLPHLSFPGKFRWDMILVSGGSGTGNVD